jgi:hypothetical protein
MPIDEPMQIAVSMARDAHRRAHADRGVHGVPRRAVGERVAADVAGNGQVLPESRQADREPEVRAAWAHGRWAWKQRRRVARRGLGRLGHDGFAEQVCQRRAQHVGCQLADRRQQVLTVAGDAVGARLHLDQRLDLLGDHQRVDGLCEGADPLDRQRRAEAELEHRGVGERLLHVHEGRPRGDEADATVRPIVDDVERRRLARLAQRAVAGVVAGQAAFRRRRGHHPAVGIEMEAARRMRLACADRHRVLDVADARGQAQDHRRLVFLRDLERRLDHRQRLLGVGRLEHRHVAEAAPVARVLFVLRRRDADVVGDRDHQAADHAGQRLAHQRVGGDVEPDLLHGREAARAGHAGADRDLQRHLLVDRPLGVQVGEVA